VSFLRYEKGISTLRNVDLTLDTIWQGAADAELQPHPDDDFDEKQEQTGMKQFHHVKPLGSFQDPLLLLSSYLSDTFQADYNIVGGISSTYVSHVVANAPLLYVFRMLSLCPGEWRSAQKRTGIDILLSLER
jgi:hypothetical protein